MSDFGATDQFSLQRFESPLTTSALLPIKRKSPMTFLRQVPILVSESGEECQYAARTTNGGERLLTSATCHSARLP